MLSACCTNYLNKENSDNVKVFCRLIITFCPKLKKNKMASCGVPGCTNRANKNSNIITLATILTMLL